MFSDTRWECNTPPSPKGNGFPVFDQVFFLNLDAVDFRCRRIQRWYLSIFHLHSRLVASLFPTLSRFSAVYFSQIGSGSTILCKVSDLSSIQPSLSPQLSRNLRIQPQPFDQPVQPVIYRVLSTITPTAYTMHIKKAPKKKMPCIFHVLLYHLVTHQMI